MTTADDPVTDELVAFLRGYFGLARATADLDLFATGALDSMQVVELLVFVEERFGVTLAPEDVRPETFGTAARIAESIRRARG